jgi:hypothetical protein
MSVSQVWKGLTGGSELLESLDRKLFDIYQHVETLRATKKSLLNSAVSHALKVRASPGEQAPEAVMITVEAARISLSEYVYFAMNVVTNIQATLGDEHFALDEETTRGFNETYHRLLRVRDQFEGYRSILDQAKLKGKRTSVTVRKRIHQHL